MERGDLNRFYGENVGLVHSVAQRGYRRLMAIGAGVEYEDLVQDLTEVFIKSFDLFDSEQAAFSTYFIRAAYNKINRIAEGYEKERIELRIYSVEEMASWGDSEDDDGVSERIASDCVTPEQSVMIQCTVSEITKALSPLAAMLVAMAMDPPEFIEREFDAAQAHASYARSLGVERRARGSLNVAFVCDVLKKTTSLPDSAIRAARAEIQSVVGKYTK